MKSFIAALRSLVLPYGRTTGRRIVLDGDNGVIDVYDATSTLAVRITSQTPAGITVYGPDGQIQLSGEEGTWTAADGSKIVIQAGAGATQYLTPEDVALVTWNPGLLTTTLGAASRGGVELASPATTVNPRQAAIDLFGGGPTTTDTSMLVLADVTSISDDMTIFGDITLYSSWNTYTPAITGAGVATYFTVTGFWKRIGDEISFVAYVNVNAAGSGAANVTITAPTNIYRGTRQTVFMQADNITPALEGSCSVVGFTGGAGAVWDRLRGRDNTNITGADLLAGCLLIVQGSYREA